MTHEQDEPGYRVSSFCGSAGCVGIGFSATNELLVGDTVIPGSPGLRFPAEGGSAFINLLKMGQFQRA